MRPPAPLVKSDDGGSHKGKTRHVWKSSRMLKEEFQSSLEILDEMRSIRCIEHNGKAKFITPFVGAQKNICEAFGFAIPEGCGTDYKSRKVSP